MTGHPIDPFDVLACHNAGMTTQETAERLDCSVHAVRDNAREMGLRFRDSRSPDAATLARMVAMREAGATYREIAAATGRCTSGVRKLIIRATKETA